VLFAPVAFSRRLRPQMQPSCLIPTMRELRDPRKSDYALATSSGRATCEIKPTIGESGVSAMTYDKLGGMPTLSLLAKLKLARDDAAYQYAEVYAQWARYKALECWKRAAAARPGLVDLKSDPLLDRCAKSRTSSIEQSEVPS